MARPKKNQEGPSAVERMRAAFWELLEEKPYSAITVKLLTKRACVNHNTFYYHFANIDDMAMRFFRDNVPDELLKSIICMVSGKESDLDAVREVPDMALHFHRVRLVLKSGSHSFIEAARRQLVKTWMGELGIGEEEVSAADWAKLNFVWGGTTALMASEEAKTFEDYFAHLQDGIVDCVSQLVRSIGIEHGVVKQ